MFFDRSGTKIDAARLRYLYRQPEYRRIEIDTMVTIGAPSRWEKQVTVVTEWEGYDHEAGDRRIFATMVFGGKLDTKEFRWATEAQAREGHAHIVHRVREELRLL